MIARNALAAALALTASGCTKKNPDYCASSMECSDGEVCDLSTHGCESRPDGMLTDGATADAAPPACDPSKPFDPAAEVPGIHDALFNDSHATLTDDELTIYFASDRLYAKNYIYRATRPTRDAPFAGSTALLGDADGAQEPSVTPDGNTIYFVTYKTSGLQLLTSTRPDATSLFPSPTSLPGQNLVEPSITADGETLYLSNLATGRLARMRKINGVFGAANDVDTQLNYTQISPATRDDLTLYLTLRNGAVHVTKRTSTTALWPMPAPVTELNTQNEEWLPSWVSTDGCRLYMTYAPGGAKSRIYMATRPL